MQIPTLDTYTLPSASAAFERAVEESRKARIKRLQLDHERALARRGPDTGVVGYMKTIQADRRDAALMLGWMKARQREDKRERTVTLDAGAMW